MKNVFVFRYVFVIAAICILSVSCDDDDEKSKTDLLTAKSWKYSKFGLKLDTAPEVDVTDDFMEDCLKDDVLIFKKDKVFSVEIGSNLCDVGQTGTNGTWAWKENETVLTITDDGVTDDFTVITLTESTLKINLGTEEFDIDGDGNDEEVTLSYTLIH